jgi:CTP:molybdopterin cytidylyltransferase MocA
MPTPEPRTSAVILAAGRSSRTEFPKLALPFKGEPLIAHALRALDRPGVSERVVVLGHHRDVLEPFVLEAGGGRRSPVRIALNPDPEGDMASSIRVGIGAASAGSDWFAILPADLPFLRPETVDRLLAEAARCRSLKRPPLLVPVRDGRGGHPVLVPETLRADLLGSSPGWTLRDWVHGVTYPVREVEVEDEGIHRDVDTRGDLEGIE